MKISAETIPLLRTTCGKAFSRAQQHALEAKDLIEAVGAEIERYTGKVCGSCANVCCINRHSRHDRSDIIFLTALGNEVPEDLSRRDETAPCRFLGSRGCVLERYQRPYRCTWFFCSSLLDHIAETSGPAGYRKFVAELRNITEKRTLMMHAFEKEFPAGKAP